MTGPLLAVGETMALLTTATDFSLIVSAIWKSRPANTEIPMVRK